MRTLGAARAAAHLFTSRTQAQHDVLPTLNLPCALRTAVGSAMRIHRMQLQSRRGLRREALRTLPAHLMARLFKRLLSLGGFTAAHALRTRSVRD